MDRTETCLCLCMIGPSCINMDICYVLCTQGSLLLCRYLLPVFSEFHQKLHMISTTSNTYSFWKMHSNFMLFCSLGRQLCLTSLKKKKKNPSFRNLCLNPVTRTLELVFVAAAQHGLTPEPAAY